MDSDIAGNPDLAKDGGGLIATKEDGSGETTKPSGTGEHGDNFGPPIDDTQANLPPTLPPDNRPRLPSPVWPKTDDRQFNGRLQSNTRQNGQVDDAARAEGLTKEQRKQLGRAVAQEPRVYSSSLSYQYIREMARDIKLGDQY